MNLPVTLPLLFAYSFAVGFAAVITPGPVSTAIVTESARRGFIVGPLVATGHVALEFVMVLLLALGLGAGLNTPTVTNVIAVLGGALLLWMGASMAWGGYKGRISLPKAGSETKQLSNWQLLGLGMGATLVNPFWYAWWFTLGTIYMSGPQVRALGFAGLLAFYFGHITGDYLWDCILSGVVGGGRKWISDRLYKGLIVACGLYLVYLGYVFIASAFGTTTL
jgi:threonine/homoserine/homoserine lactone efflux protein